MEGEDENKSASLAIGAGIVMTVLDRIGIKGLGGFAAKNPTKTLQEAANKYAKERAISQAEAGGIVKQATDTVIAEFAEKVESLAKEI